MSEIETLDVLLQAVMAGKDDDGSDMAVGRAPYKVCKSLLAVQKFMEYDFQSFEFTMF